MPGLTHIVTFLLYLLLLAYFFLLGETHKMPW